MSLRWHGLPSRLCVKNIYAFVKTLYTAIYFVLCDSLQTKATFMWPIGSFQKRFESEKTLNAPRFCKTGSCCSGFMNVSLLIGQSDCDIAPARYISKYCPTPDGLVTNDESDGSVSENASFTIALVILQVFRKFWPWRNDGNMRFIHLRPNK